ncbi:MAG TPA: glycerol-3-phosphate 1-O-acyltransferase PlsY [Gemmataceae bacterium]|nr:glycerol-3-phosphate 1-O-acyltransferase PlsY [Gemmataceae bacterium]
MDIYLTFAATALVSYFIGAIPFGYLIARYRGVDIFQHGSGNIGATNVGRILGWPFGILVFMLDFAKGAVPAAVGLAVGAARDIEAPVALGVAAGLAAFVGHLFPAYLRFRGGKGVATGAGVVAVLLPLPTLAALIAWLVTVSVSRYVSLASIAAAAVLCAVHFAMTPEPFAPQQLILTLFCLVAVALVFVKHRTNVRRLLDGSENRLSDSRSMRLLTKTIHVLAVGLWFGMAVFFSFPVALTLFGSFETLAESNERPTWFPLPPEYKLEPGLQKSQGTRAAGHAISPLFDHYFLWQGVCGLLATVTALSWSKAEPGRRVHSVRSLVLLLALTTVVLGWPIERNVSDLRHARNAASDDLMAVANTPASSAMIVAAARAQVDNTRQEFATWHLWSLLLNMVTIGLVTAAMALTAQLPPNQSVSGGKLQTKEN